MTANAVSQKNGVKKTSYAASAEALQGLRSDLRQIAADADKEINAIAQSKRPLPQKVTEIGAAIEKYSTYASHKAAQRSSAITQALSEVLLAQGDGRTPTEFALAHGIDIGKPQQLTQENIRSYVEQTLKNSTGDLTEYTNTAPNARTVDLISSKAEPTPPTTGVGLDVNSVDTPQVQAHQNPTAAPFEPTAPKRITTDTLIGAGTPPTALPDATPI
ncbi:hypothetical protein, partial [Mycobacterium sp. ACS4331]|uniref:hypothetical protein n=1 Tax=Mycobacterium sp. ACS4331 TaxID=1834121 RepID=UPI0012F791C5